MANRERDERKAKLREERLREEAAAQASERRERLRQAAAPRPCSRRSWSSSPSIVISQSGSDSDGGNAGDIADAGLVNGQLEGIPQDGLVLGEPGATAKVIEFGDLQCPVCKEYAETVIPKLIAGPVRQGKAKLEFRNYLIIGAAVARLPGRRRSPPGEQGKRLELHRALLPQPGNRELRLRRRRLPGGGRAGRRGARTSRSGTATARAPRSRRR